MIGGGLASEAAPDPPPGEGGKSLALFDFDGTISRKDSLWDFILFAVGWRKFGLGVLRLLPILVQCKCGVLDNQTAKAAVLGYFFKGWPVVDFDNLGSRYAVEKLPGIIKDSAMSRLAWHQGQGHTVVVVTASLANWLRSWCNSHGVALVATRLEVKNGLVTGLFAGPNCQGPEKVRRIKAEYDLSRFAFIYAYGDSHGDREMLALANEGRYRCFL